MKGDSNWAHQGLLDVFYPLTFLVKEDYIILGHTEWKWTNAKPFEMCVNLSRTSRKSCDIRQNVFHTQVSTRRISYTHSHHIKIIKEQPSKEHILKIRNVRSPRSHFHPSHGQQEHEWALRDKISLKQTNKLLDHAQLKHPTYRTEFIKGQNTPASDPFFPSADGTTVETSAGGASSVRASLHCANVTYRHSKYRYQVP